MFVSLRTQQLSLNVKIINIRLFLDQAEKVVSMHHTKMFLHSPHLTTGNNYMYHTLDFLNK